MAPMTPVTRAGRWATGIVLVAVNAGMAMAAPAPAVPKPQDARATHGALLAMAERRIAACLAQAVREQHPPLSIAVIDTTGSLVAFIRQDGASAATTEAALLKARTALRTAMPTATLAAAAATDAQTRDALLVLQLAGLGGGFPIAGIPGTPSGAVGVSGASVEVDHRCAQVAAEQQ